MMRWALTGSESSINKLRPKLEELDDEIAHHWPDRQAHFDSGMEPAEEAMTKMDDIAKSHGLIVIIGNPKVAKPISETLLGIAVALNKRVVLIGRPHTPFHHLPTVERYTNVADFITTREDEKNVDV